MAYQNNIPQPTDNLAKSQGDLLGNFQAIKTLVDVNHVTFDTADQGKHKFVTFPVQAGSPPIVFNAGELALYSFFNGTTGQNELYINKTNQATVVQVPTTGSVLSSNSAPAAPVIGTAQAGWSYLPSGIIVKWGNAITTATSNTLTNIFYNVGVNTPAFTQVLNVMISPTHVGPSSASDPNNFVTLDSLPNNTFFRVWGSSRSSSGFKASVPFFWLAIGY